MSLNRGIGSAQYMNKRIPRNAKYQHVKTRLDTGCSISKYMERLEEIQKNYKYRKDENFKRLKVTTFAQLILQVASVSDLNESDDSELHSLDDLSEHTNGSPRPLSDRQDLGDNRDICYTSRSTLLSVISGVGELNLDGNNEKMENEPADSAYPDCPYLLLDVRDRDQYDRCHIISAHSFPVATLSRTMNPYTKEVLKYKNAAGKIIIVYDEDERVASQAATIMCERGFENLLMLSGGLKVIAQKFPEGLTTGSIPASCLPSPTSSKRKKSSVPQMPQMQQQQPPSQAAEKRWWFMSDELSMIQDQLDETLSPCTSRVSSSLKHSALGVNRAPLQRAQSSRPWK